MIQPPLDRAFEWFGLRSRSLATATSSNRRASTRIEDVLDVSRSSVAPECFGVWVVVADIQSTLAETHVR